MWRQGACGIRIRAFELAVRYAQQRSTFGKPIAEHQAIAFQLAEMATKVEAAHLMTVNAARLKDRGTQRPRRRNGEILASEYCKKSPSRVSASTVVTVTQGLRNRTAHARRTLPPDR